MRGNHARRDSGRWVDEIDDTPFADECDAFLDGRWAEIREDTTRPLPMWAWLNPIAHGDLVRVRAIAAIVDPMPGPQRLQGAVARAVLTAVQGSELSMVQRHVLVPLELRLMEQPASPRQVLELVTDALY